MDLNDFVKHFHYVSKEKSESTCLIVEDCSGNFSEFNYGEVYEMACQVHGALDAYSVSSKKLVAIMMEHGSDLLISVLGCLLHRSPFLMLEPSVPLLRLEQMLNDAQPSLLIIGKYQSLAGLHLSKMIQVCSFPDLIEKRLSNEEFSPHSVTDPMYIMYTSGSTGKPKGVIVPYLSMYNRFQWMWTTYPWCSSDVQLWKTSTMFGDCIWEMLGGLLSGVPTLIGRMATVRDPYLLVKLIAKGRVTRITLIPSLLSAMLKLLAVTGMNSLDSLRHVIVSGEVLSKAICQQYFTSSINALLLNLYGSTEIGNDAIYYEVESLSDSDSMVPIGRPIAGINYKIVDDELWITGNGLSNGYFNNLALTNEKFVIDSDDHRRYFKTGDRVQLDSHGKNLLFLGRMDDEQVKIRGARIELAEIEAICVQHDQIQETGCIYFAPTNQLVAFVQVSTKSLHESDLRQWLSAYLNEYQMPSVFIFVNKSLPRTASGKLDRRQLKLLFENQQQQATWKLENDENGIAGKVAQLWIQALNLKTNQENLTFTELGGHSLLAIQLQGEFYEQFGVHIAIEQFFQRTTLADLIALVKISSSTTASIPIVLTDETESIALTSTQKSIWIADEIESSCSSAYNIISAFEIISNEISTNQVKEAVHQLLERHTVLRSVFLHSTQGELRQRVCRLEEKELTLMGVNLFAIVEVNDQSQIEATIINLSRIKFNLKQSKPLCRFYWCVSENRRVLAIVLHHTIIDGWSLKILGNDLDHLLTSEPLTTVPMQFYQYVQMEERKDRENDLKYWKTKLNDGAIPRASLLHDHQEDQQRGDLIQMEFPSDLTDLIRNFSRQHDATPFMLLLTTFKSLLVHYTNTNSISLGIQVANRTRPIIEKTVGLFTNTVVSYDDNLSMEKSLLQLLGEVKTTVLEAFAHQTLPFAELLSYLPRLTRDSIQSGLFQILFAYQNVEDGESMSVLRRIRFSDQMPRFEIDVEVWTETNNFLVEVHYRADLFEKQTIHRLIQAWICLTRSALINPFGNLTTWPLVTSQDQLSTTVGPPGVDNKRNLCQIFDEKVKHTPNEIAVEDGSKHWTYQDLWNNAVCFSQQIRLLVQHNGSQCIAIRMNRTADLIVTIWSVLFSGHHYVFIDPDLPTERQRFILEDTSAKLMITDTDSHELNVSVMRFQVSCYSFTDQFMVPNTSSSDLVYILYTSGSTGQPKGVCATHGAIMTRMLSGDHFHLKQGIRVAQMSSFSFDMSTFEVFGTLLNGGTLVIVPPESICSAKALHELQLDVISPSTAIFNTLVEQPASIYLFNNIKHVYFGGEKVNMKYVRRALETIDPSSTSEKLIHVYGPTEATVFTLYYPILCEISPSAKTIPIGRPLPDTNVYIVDLQGQLVPIGVPGELWIGGKGLSIGYQNLRDLTETRFMKNPFGEGKIYCSGDICRMRNDRMIEYLHRRDNQVKLRSQRLELGEIEFHLMQHAAVDNAVVLLRDDVVQDEQVLVGYVQSAVHLNEDEIRDFLMLTLPTYMVPSYFVFVTRLPLNHVGKIDRKALPLPCQSTSTDLNVIDIVHQICADILKRKEIDPKLNFFKLGGNSLSGMQLVARLYERFGIQTKMTSLFRARSMLEFSQAVLSQINEKTVSQHSTVVQTTKVRPRRAPLTSAQLQFWFFWKLRPTSGFYNIPIVFDVTGQINVESIERSFHHLVNKYDLLHTKFSNENDDRPWQEEMIHWKLNLLEDRVHTESDLRERLKYYSTKSFDLNDGEVYRFVLLHLNENHHFLLICFHHIVCDGNCITAFIDEFLGLYASSERTSSTNAPSFLDYAHRSMDNLNTTVALDEMAEYLKDFKMLDFANIELLNAKEEDVSLLSYIASTLINIDTADNLRHIATEQSCTLHTILLTIFKCLLSCLCNDTSDIVLGVIMSIRSQTFDERLFGPLINSVPIRTKLPDSPTTRFSELLQTVRSSSHFAFEHQHVPFADIVQKLRKFNNDPSLCSYLPVFRVIFEMNSYQLFDRSATLSDGTQWKNYCDQPSLLPFTKSDLDLEVVDYGLGQPLKVTVNTNRSVFHADTAEMILKCCQTAINIVAHDSHCSRSFLWREMKRIICPSNYDTITKIFHEQVEHRENHPAIIHGNDIWTYRELNERAVAIARSLCDARVKTGDVVAIQIDRSPFMVAAMFGVLMAGATYLYLDPELPKQRVIMLLKDAKVSIIIRQSSLSTSLQNDEYQYLSESIMFSKSYTILPEIQSSYYCYLIYTSGSTGEPKGVKIQHQAVIKRINLPVNIAPSAVVGQLTSCSFDVYILEIYGALLNGATLTIFDKSYTFQPKLLAQEIQKQNVTHLFIPTPIFNLLAEHAPSVFSGMECVLFAGDRANTKLVRTVLETKHLPKNLINAYGPTETTCIVTWYNIMNNINHVLKSDSDIPIGEALWDTPLYIVDPLTMTLIEDGNRDGELIIGGYGVAEGYTNNADETVKRFVPNIFTNSGGKLYRTGDRVRKDRNGNYHFLGRLDSQVKINGYRIELGEIEHTLETYPSIVEASVVIRDDLIPNTRTIVAYIRPSQHNQAEIRQYLAQMLPHYMLPSSIIPVDSIPLSSSGGKRDPKYLLSPIQTIDNSYKSKIQQAWNDILSMPGAEKIFHDDDDFFACGGTSINIIQLHAKLESLFNVQLDINQLFKERTLGQQIKWIKNRRRPSGVDEVRLKPVSKPRTRTAIVGMSARYGPVETLIDLWAALQQGQNCCINKTHAKLIDEDPTIAKLILTNPNYVHAGGMMDNAHCFDHKFFEMTKRDADMTDPQHRILLEATYEALEDAGVVPNSYEGTIGVFGAVYRNTYATYHNLLMANPFEVYDVEKSKMGIVNLDSATVMRAEIGNMIDGAPTFISYKLGLNGPSMSIQTACSSSGTALHMALRSLEVGDCTVAIVAGVCINFPLGLGYNYQPGMIMSKSGVCRSFDEDADGVVGGDGAGVVILMREDEALKHGYGIRALITGYAINNDGHDKASFSTTSPDRQADCMRAALGMAQIDEPQLQVDYVEAHGPGTSMGDLLEVQALTKAYSTKDVSRNIYVGSIKANVGHTAHAATLAGLIKIVLSLQAEEIPPAANFRRLNSNIKRLNPPFDVNKTRIPWPSSLKTGRIRRAGLNALGQGGTNSHFIIEEWPSQPMIEQQTSSQLFVFSAKTREALMKIKQRSIKYLLSLDQKQWNNASFTLACGRTHYNERDFVVVSSKERLYENMDHLNSSFQETSTSTNCIVFVFPGQGSQYEGMARDLYERFPYTFGQSVDKCLKILKLLDEQTAEIVHNCLFDSHPELDQYAQLVLFIIEYSLCTFLVSLKVKPNYLIGHSSGEYVAAVVAEVLTVENALKLLVCRCRLMKNLPASRMLAVEIDAQRKDALALTTTYDVNIAVQNSCRQTIYAGPVKNIERMEKELLQRGMKVKLLKTSGAFHSRLMEPISKQMRSSYDQLQYSEPKIPIVSTVTGNLIENREMASSNYWCAQMTKPVLFRSAIENMLADNFIKNDSSTIFVSVGPGKGLNSQLKQLVPKSTVLTATILQGNYSALDTVLGSLWSRRVDVNWSIYFDGLSCQRISLPTYPFERTICKANNRARLQLESENSCPTTSSGCLPERVNIKSMLNSIPFNNCKKSSAAPWKIPKTVPSLIIKLFNLSSNTSEVIRSTGIITDQTLLATGSNGKIFVDGLYYYAVNTGLIKANQHISTLVPSEYCPINYDLTLEDLVHGRVDTNQPYDTISDLLMVLHNQCHTSTRGPNNFSNALLGHTMAALYETSFEDLVQHLIINQLELKSTKLNCAVTSEASTPNSGFVTNISDLEKILTLSDTQAMALAIRRALKSESVQYTGHETILLTTHPSNSNYALIIASDQPIDQSKYEMIVEETTNRVIMEKPSSSIDYMSEIQDCLIQLLGTSDFCQQIPSNTSFDQLHIDSLQAITLIELLSKRFSIQLPIDTIVKYPSLSSLASYLKNESQFMDSSTEVCHNYILNKEAGIPYVYEANVEHRSLAALENFIQRNKFDLLKQLGQKGALLFRGFQVETADDFSRVVELLSDSKKSFHDYRDGISPRTRINDKVFTSTEYPSQYHMALHNELSYSKRMPSLIFFFCQTPPRDGTGGETPIGDSAAIYEAIDLEIRDQFIEKQLLYVTNMPSRATGAIGKSWQDTYQTESKLEVERFLNEQSIEFQWLPNEILRTFRRGSAIRQHPITGRTTWCNHAHLFHPTDLEENARRILERRLQPFEMPKNCFFGDGSSIPSESLDHIRRVLAKHQVQWSWCKGDVLILDNLLVAHGRAAFKDPMRRILVAMA